MFKTIIRLITQRNLKPTSIFEKVGDWLITPFSFFLRNNKFKVIGKGNEKFSYAHAEESRFTNSENKLFIARLIAVILTPAAIPGFLIKLPGLVFSKEMRDTYFDWKIPITAEYCYLSHDKNEDRLLARIWNNDGIIRAAIKNNSANLLMTDIVNNQRQWFVEYKEDFYIKHLFSKTNMSLSPDISECLCCQTGNFNRHLTNRRQKIENEMANYSKDLVLQNNKLRYLSLGANGLLQELMNIYIFISQQRNIDVYLIDKKFNSISTDRTFANQAELFIDFIKAISSETNVTVNIRFFNSINDVSKDEKFDIISIIDFDDIKKEFADVCESYKHLKHQGRLYLAVDTKNFTYDDQKCLATNSEIPLSLTTHKEEKTHISDEKVHSENISQDRSQHTAASKINKSITCGRQFSGSSVTFRPNKSAAACDDPLPPQQTSYARPSN